MTRVLLCYFSELGGLGGVEVAVLQLANEFSKLGNPSGIAEIGEQWKPKRLVANGIPVWCLTAPSYPSARRPRSWASFARVTYQFLRTVDEFAPDIVHVHYPLSQSLPVIGAHVLPHRWRLIVTVHNSDIRVSPFEEPRIRPWQARLFRRADAVTAVSRSLLDDATKLYPEIAGKGSVIYNGIGQNWFREPAREPLCDEKYALFVGRLHEAKGADVLLRAWKQLSHEFPALQLWLVGDGPERCSLEALARELGIASLVRFIGRKNQAELHSLYRQAQFVVLPSRREGLPFTLLEAQASGALCIATRIPGVLELIQDGTTGLLADPESAASLASTISRFFTMPSDQRHLLRMGAYSRIREQFSEERMIANYLKVFETVSPRGRD